MAQRYGDAGSDRPGEQTGAGGTELRQPMDQEHYMNIVTRFVNDESGATAIEYGLIAAGISVAIIAVVNSLGTQLKSTFSTITSQLATAGK